MHNMAGLKALVVFMGILIAAGIGLLAYAVIGGLPDRAAGGFGNAEVLLPPGCVVAQAQVSEGILVLRVEGPAERGCQQVILVDSESGQERGRVSIKEAP
jgi:hypothetical protein